MKIYENLITILTPTYNRRYTLDKLYTSLCRQTKYDFEWIIIDDGSTDDTEKYCNTLQEINFQIRYYKQQNGGKHRAINYGVSKAKGNYIFIVDSDDTLVADAIETVLKWINDTTSNNKLAGVAGLRGYKTTGKRIGQFPNNKSYVDAKNTERRKKYLLGDKAEIYKTEILRKYPFKEFVKENFLSESTVWDEIAYQGYSLRWFNKIIYLGDYLEDGLTKQANKELNNFEGFTYSVQQRIKSYPLLDGIFAKGYFFSIAQQKNLNLKQSAHKLGVNIISLWVCVCLYKLKNTLKLLFRKMSINK